MLFTAVGPNDFVDLHTVNRIRKVPNTDLWEIYFHAGTILEKPITVSEKTIRPLLRKKQSIDSESITQL